MTLGRKVIHKLLVFFLFTVTLFCESCTAVAIEENGAGENVLTVDKSTKVKTDEIASNSDEKKDNAIEQITKETKKSSIYQEGKASYMSYSMDGGPTASGVKFSVKELTAAHKTLKFGTLVKVTNKKNGKSVIVKIIDRGPFTKGRVIDMSPAAFKEIASLNDGVANVTLEVVEKD